MMQHSEDSSCGRPTGMFCRVPNGVFCRVRGQALATQPNKKAGRVCGLPSSGEMKPYCLS